MMNEGHNKEALALDALGALDEAEQRAFEAHLAACLECRRERDELLDAAASLAHTVAPVAPPEPLRASLLEQVRELKTTGVPARTAPDSGHKTTESAGGRVITPPAERFTRKPERRSAWLTYGALAAAVTLTLMSAALFMLWRENRELRGEMARLSESVNAAQDELAREREEAARQREIAELLAAPQSRMMTLTGTKDAPGATARLAYDSASGRAMLFASGLPPAPAGKAYQMWYIAGGKPLPGRVFHTDPSGRGTLRDEMPAEGRDAKTFAVTLEPEQGVSAPTSAPYLVGTVS